MRQGEMGLLWLRSMESQILQSILAICVILTLVHEAIL